jgi:hypothetical protein
MSAQQIFFVECSRAAINELLGLRHENPFNASGSVHDFADAGAIQVDVPGLCHEHG